MQDLKSLLLKQVVGDGLLPQPELIARTLVAERLQGVLMSVPQSTCRELFESLYSDFPNPAQARHQMKAIINLMTKALTKASAYDEALDITETFQ